MMTGNLQFDPNVKLPLDSFGNGHDVDTPSWTDASVQFTHGYPRHLVTSQWQPVNNTKLFITC